MTKQMRRRALTACLCICCLGFETPVNFIVTKTRRDKIKKPMVFETPVNFMVTKTITAPQKPFAFETPANFMVTKTDPAKRISV